MTRSLPRLVILTVLAVLVLGGAGVVTWALTRDVSVSPPSDNVPTAPSGHEGVDQAASAAAGLPTDRQAALHPQLPDDPRYVPAYPPDTTVTLDQTSWVQAGESASAFARVVPPDVQVLVHFQRFEGRWYITEIEPEP